MGPGGLLSLALPEALPMAAIGPRRGALLAVVAGLLLATPTLAREEKRPKDEAVTRGLTWLAKLQQKDGSWAPAKADDDVRVTQTALAVLAFLGAGETHAKGDHAKAVKAGLQSLQRARDRKTGRFADAPVAHALATVALTECYGLTTDAAIKASAQRGANACAVGQDAKRGGWPAKTGGDPDVAATTWNLMALKSAQLAGLTVPKASLRQAEKYLDSLAAKLPHESAAMAACCRLWLGASPRNAKLTAWVDSLGKQPAAATSAEDFFTLLALHHLSAEKHKARWGDKKTGRPALVARQGAKTGAWPGNKATLVPNSDVVETAFALLRLEMPTRELPLFRRDARPPGDRP
jgi:hypothetical protein